MMSIILSIFLIFQNVFSETCPPLENIWPCYCLASGNEINVKCSHLESLNELKKSVQTLAGCKIFSFVIKSSIFDFLTYDLFENVTIKELEILESNFSRIGKPGYPQFKGLEKSMETLKFVKSFTRQNPLAYVSMENLRRLTTFEVHDSQVGVIHNLWFKNGPKSLKIIRFVKGNIRTVGHTAFNSLTNLRILDLSDNELTFIPRWALPEPASFLEELNLERNKFETLPEDIFTDMPKLRIVNLELNEFSTIDEKLWRPVWNHLDLLNIDYTPMICDKNIKWIYDCTIDLKRKLIATCYKPFTLIERELHSLKPEEIK